MATFYFIQKIIFAIKQVLEKLWGDSLFRKPLQLKPENIVWESELLLSAWVDYSWFSKRTFSEPGDAILHTKCHFPEPGDAILYAKCIASVLINNVLGRNHPP